MSNIDPITGKRILTTAAAALPRGPPGHAPATRTTWRTNLRYEGQYAKMMFHPTAEDPTIPNAGIVR